MFFSNTTNPYNSLQIFRSPQKPSGISNPKYSPMGKRYRVSFATLIIPFSPLTWKRYRRVFSNNLNFLHRTRFVSDGVQNGMEKSGSFHSRRVCSVFTDNSHFLESVRKSRCVV